MSIAFVACVESGPLEEQGVLLFNSIRRWAGRHAGSRLVSVEPRGAGGLRPATLSAFSELGVDHSVEGLNTEFPGYPIANKILTAAWAETTLPDDVVVFVDTDTLFMAEPAALELDEGVVAAARPVGQKKHGSSGADDPNDAYWLAMYESRGLSPGPYVETVMTGERIRGYWSAGIVAARRDAGVFAAWRRDFLALMAARHIPNGGKRNMDQVSLAATLTRVGQGLHELDWGYNYLLRRRPRLPEPLRSAALEELVHVHYRHWLHQPGFLDEIEPPFPDSERMDWLRGFLPLRPPGEPVPG